MKVKLSQDNYTKANIEKYLAQAREKSDKVLQFWTTHMDFPWITLNVEDGAQIVGYTEYPHAFGCSLFDDKKCDCGYDK